MNFVCCDQPHATRLTLHLLSSIAEHEAAMISERTKSALQAARARGVKLGGERGDHRIARYAGKGRLTSAAVRAARAAARAVDLAPIIAEIRASGATSLREIAHELNQRGIQAPRGGEWTSVQVSRLLAQAPLTSKVTPATEVL